MAINNIENSYEQVWLEYKLDKDSSYKRFFSNYYINFSGDISNNIIKELALFTNKKFGYNITECKSIKDSTLILKLVSDKTLGDEGFDFSLTKTQVIIKANNAVGVLYGVFHIIRDVNCNSTILEYNFKSIPQNPLRILNHWDNMSGEIERGYSGKSFFFKDGEIIINERIKDYARIIASVGINTININNVNVYDAHKLITEEYLEKLNTLTDIFKGYGIKLFISVSFASPMVIGGLNSADPLNKDVITWWKDRCRLIYKMVPELGGFLIKADSEGRPGPFTYGRTHADGANMLAECIDEFNGIIIWRCFVYNCQQDWRDTKTDRARSGYDNFKPLDGKFKDNVILQIKNGPMDFQVREPVSPLFGGLENTNQLLEVQIAQEYTGQQKHVCYLIPMFKEILDFNTYCNSKYGKVSDIISGKTFNKTNTGIVAVTNTGDDQNWTGHDLAGANLYGFARLAWDTTLTANQIAEEWIKQTFNNNKKVVDIVSGILLNSWESYEKYNAPLGIGWMVNPNNHFGPNVDGYEYDRWGTYHRADHLGVGIDRTKTGTGFTLQFYKKNEELFSNIKTCPDELKLFFHRLDYNFVLDSGKTIIQHIYDSHFDGVEDVESFLKNWKNLKALIDNKSYKRVLDRLKFQLTHAKEWRDVINTYFYRKSSISDKKGRYIY
ncbi:alpha-glucuronidase [Thiospirochaeta perfilievii]|uniref:Alpha-glucuronidase n=1 Tax=Thiospirochaeta perfilievii TaxID=252967 RepID=A0A5C1Q7T3_9SPIO|nr:alpha-glucuronidase [Thiospirochaeta perfilievii]QEN03447.1 alpha-glucuronidase [Thiospirochaeta perfilievii]